jgi:hypothetical protein
MSGISSNIYANALLHQVPNPSRTAFNPLVAEESTYLPNKLPASLNYSRRYLDWNRLTFEYHAEGSQSMPFDSQHGQAITALITAERQQLNLNSVYGCAPQTWCIDCQPFGHESNIFTLAKEALAAVIVNKTRADVARFIVIPTGNIRYDLIKGALTYDDSFIVSPFANTFQFIQDVPYQSASVSFCSFERIEIEPYR